MNNNNNTPWDITNHTLYDYICVLHDGPNDDETHKYDSHTFDRMIMTAMEWNMITLPQMITDMFTWEHSTPPPPPPPNAEETTMFVLRGSIEIPQSLPQPRTVCDVFGATDVTMGSILNWNGLQDTDPWFVWRVSAATQSESEREAIVAAFKKNVETELALLGDATARAVVGGRGLLEDYLALPFTKHNLLALCAHNIRIPLGIIIIRAQPYKIANWQHQPHHIAAAGGMETENRIYLPQPVWWRPARPQICIQRQSSPTTTTTYSSQRYW
jgi:hypothetical protein